MDTRHTLLTHNLSGFRSDIVEGLLREGFSFLFLQETHHFNSSKDLFDKSNRYKTFHVSSMNEHESNHAHVGGLVTYVSNDSVTNTEVLASCKHYLITITGKLVCINHQICDFPQKSKGVTPFSQGRRRGVFFHTHHTHDFLSIIPIIPMISEFIYNKIFKFNSII